MADQTQRLELATVKAEIGSDIISRFANDPVEAEPIPTDSGDIQNLKQVAAEIKTDGQAAVDTAVAEGIVELTSSVTSAGESADRSESAAAMSAAASHPFPSTTDGLANTSGTGATNRYFSVPGSGSSLATLYRNDAGAAIAIGQAPSASLVGSLDLVLTPMSKVFKPYSRSRSGWYGAQVDKFNRILTAIKSTTNARHHFISQVFEATVSVKTALYGARSVAYGSATQRSGYVWATVDKFKRIVFGQKTDGSIWAWGKRLLNSDDRADLEALIDSNAPSATTYVYASVDAAGKKQVFGRDKASGLIRRLSSAGSNNFDLQVTTDGLNVMYSSDRVGGLGPGRLAAPLAGGAERLVVPRIARLTTFGDSLTYGQGASNPATQSWPAVVSAATGWTVTNRALQGFTSMGQAGLAGAIPTLVTATGNSIAGAGATTIITSVSTYLLSAHNGSFTDALTRTITGSLVGQRGTLRRTAVGSPGTYTDLYEFTSDPGAITTSCPPSSLFTPDAQDQDNEILGICLGTNTGAKVPESAETTKANIVALVNWAKPLYPMILLFGVPVPRPDGPAINAYLRQEFPQFYMVDSLGRDLYQRLIASGDGSVADNEYLALGRLPKSLLATPDSGDYTHLNTHGYSIWAQFANEIIQSRGYNI